MSAARPLALILALAAALPAGAQDRPPAAEAVEALPEGERPPERPDELVSDEALPPAEEAAVPAAEDDAPSGPPSADIPPAEDETTSAEEAGEVAAATAEPFGPPAPPVWFTLAESDGDHAACRMALRVLGTRFAPEPPVTDPDNRDCGIARPLRVTEILPGVELTGSPVMRCATARSLALWAQGFLRPAAAALPEGRRLTALQTGPAYQCRTRVGTGATDPKPSEHGYGNAVDVMGFVFEGADPVPVQPRLGDGDPEESFLAAARGTACLMFTTVLGPGSNAAHDDHLHLDIAARNGGWRLCE
ncbi:extensin family protein [Paracoccus gahaiensis]|uniref:Extensin family protein n=1 Tax=Paracoccus gahaiensis TaxID=1706839 RepID=A0A4U0RCE2_9RHOB|nr:extensin family protein [Paracoccus gahaiensis]TJZ92616.1 extensin family protein [Paracoccus gahaiensis]